MPDAQQYTLHVIYNYAATISFSRGKSCSAAAAISTAYVSANKQTLISLAEITA